MRPLAGAYNDRVYRSRVPATRPAADYTARLIPHYAGVAVPPGNSANPVAALIGSPGEQPTNKATVTTCVGKWTLEQYLTSVIFHQETTVQNRPRSG